MAQYLLSHHSVDGEARDPMTDEEMQQFMTRIHVLEEEMVVLTAVVLIEKLWTRGRASHLWWPSQPLALRSRSSLFQSSPPVS
jgi:hypothetical protein